MTDPLPRDDRTAVAPRSVIGQRSVEELFEPVKGRAGRRLSAGTRGRGRQVESIEVHRFLLSVQFAQVWFRVGA
jgi:hypothetical protein